MTPSHGPDPDHVALLHRLERSFNGIYLTMLSIIQGVAVAFLATVVSEAYKQFIAVQWLLVLETLLIFTVIWYQMTMESAIWERIPSFGDSVIPFVIGAIELVLVYTIVLVTDAGVRVWLCANAISAGMGALGIWDAGRQAHRAERHAKLLVDLDRPLRFRLRFALVTTALATLLAVGSLMGKFGTGDGARSTETLYAVLLAGGVIVGFVILSIRYWNTVVAYARTGRLPQSWRSG